jgi:hypothetical protein
MGESKNVALSLGWLEHSYRLVASSLWIFWLGGITFYISIVVPIGGEVLGADIQGQVTERVTWYINWIAVAVAVLMLFEARRRQSWLLLLSTVVHSLTLAFLLASHADLSAMMRGEASKILANWSFYSVHRVYLWVTTVQWLNALLVHFLFLAAGWQRRARDASVTLN